MTRARLAALLLFCPVVCLAQAPGGIRYQSPAAYSAPDSAAVWRSLGASYVRKALKDNSLKRDPESNARMDAVMRAVGAAAGSLYPRFARSAW